MKHYTIEEIDRYVHGEMGVLSRIKCASHLKSCEECRNLVENVEKNDAFISKLRGVLCELEQNDAHTAQNTFDKIKSAMKKP